MEQNHERMMAVRRLLIIALVLLLLAGCGTEQAEASHITVSLALPEGCRALENGLQIQSGEDAVFELVLEDGYEFGSLDYDGEYETYSEDGILYVRLENVRYPTMASVSLTSHYCAIVYAPNGASGELETRYYDLSEHRRPNTAIGTDLFFRDGYTLVSWNTKTDGSGTSVGLGSRVTVTGGSLTLYAQWAKWAPESDFLWEMTNDGLKITAYLGSADPVVVPAELGGEPVAVIGSNAFLNCEATHVILPETVRILQYGAFTDCALRELTFFDSLELFVDASFENCPDFSTVHINAVEAPWGYDYRRESCLADKVDLLILAQGQQKLVFYGGCSVWYNLDGSLAQEMVGEDYRVINMGLNGVMNSSAQMQILTAFLEPGDVFFHTPEVSSSPQMMRRTEMINHDRKLWSGMEYNYDLVALLDIRTLPEFFDILYYWLSTKEQTSSYTDVYRDYLGNSYVDEFGCASFLRENSKEELDDTVALDPACFEASSMAVLEEHYREILDRGVSVYVGYACVNLDALPEEQRELVDTMDSLFRETFEAMEDVSVVGSMQDYLYCNSDFYDTNYHLLTAQAHENTQKWMADLTEQMRRDGLLQQE